MYSFLSFKIHGPIPGGSSGVTAGSATSVPTSSLPAATIPVALAPASGGTPNASKKSGVAPVKINIDTQSGSNYDEQKGTGGPSYDT
ncbi:hypothetical protein AgCh_021357 [Apium graveolens]